VRQLDFISPRSLSENSFFVISNEAERREKSEKSTTYANKISRLRLEMTILGQAPLKVLLVKGAIDPADRGLYGA